MAGADASPSPVPGAAAAPSSMTFNPSDYISPYDPGYYSSDLESPSPVSGAATSPMPWKFNPSDYLTPYDPGYYFSDSEQICFLDQVGHEEEKEVGVLFR